MDRRKKFFFSQNKICFEKIMEKEIKEAVSHQTQSERVHDMPAVPSGLHYLNHYFSKTLHDHAVNPLPEERKGFEAAVGRILNGTPMTCTLCKLPTLKHKKVLVCDPCRFVTCGKCAKKNRVQALIAITPCLDFQLPFGDRFDESKDNIWTQFRQNFSGKIVFCKVFLILDFNCQCFRILSPITKIVAIP
jgi:hypothetical protein